MYFRGGERRERREDGAGRLKRVGRGGRKRSGVGWKG